MTAQLPSRERLEQYANDPRMCNVNDEIRAMARALLAAHEQEPSGYLYRAHHHNVSTPWRYAESLPDYVIGGGWEIRPQYDTPAPVPAVPAKWPEKLTWSHHDDMTQAEVLAWNNAIDACRSALAPVPAVPDERYQHLSELYHSQEKRLFKLAQRIKGSSFDKYAYSTSQAIDVLEAAIFGESEDESRAAMLNGVNHEY